MTRKHRSQHGAAYPALRQFARAYLHEDFIAEYGGVVEAARAFRADASSAERRALAIELARLAEASVEWPQAKLSAFVTGTLGAAWATASGTALRQMADALEDADG